MKKCKHRVNWDDFEIFKVDEYMMEICVKCEKCGQVFEVSYRIKSLRKLTKSGYVSCDDEEIV